MNWGKEGVASRCLSSKMTLNATFMQNVNLTEDEIKQFSQLCATPKKLTWNFITTFLEKQKYF